MDPDATLVSRRHLHKLCYKAHRTIEHTHRLIADSRAPKARIMNVKCLVKRSMSYCDA